MDGLSVAGGVLGLISSAASIAITLNDLISKTKHAPKAVRNLKNEVDAMALLLPQVQSYVTRKKHARPSQAALILVEQVLRVLSSCILTFSDLETMVDSFNLDRQMGLLDRFRWISKASMIDETVSSLQSHKNSLQLMLDILQGDSVLDVRDTVDELKDAVEKLSSSNTSVETRLFDLEPEQGQVSAGTDASNDDTVPDSAEHEASNVSDVAPKIYKSTFEEDLNSSLAYRRLRHMGDNATISQLSTAGRSASWSMLSGLSLSEISMIAVVALPICAEDIANSDRYDFGDTGMDVEDLVASTAQVSMDAEEADKKDSTPWWRRSKKLATSRRQQAAPAVATNVPQIFGVDILTSIRYANIAISVVDAAGESYIMGYIPIVVAKCGVYLKERGTDTEHLFIKGGHPRRIQELHIIFDTPPTYGKGHDWTGFTVWDCASLMLRYLKMLPEPVIPYDHFDSFVNTNIIDALPDVRTYEYGGDADPILKELKTAVSNLNPINKQLLMYLLDLMAVFASKSNINRLTTIRLVSAFQPSILSCLSTTIERKDLENANLVLILMVDSQDYFNIPGEPSQS